MSTLVDRLRTRLTGSTVGIALFAIMVLLQILASWTTLVSRNVAGLLGLLAFCGGGFTIMMYGPLSIFSGVSGPLRPVFRWRRIAAFLAFFAAVVLLLAANFAVHKHLRLTSMETYANSGAEDAALVGAWAACERADSLFLQTDVQRCADIVLDRFGPAAMYRLGILSEKSHW